MVGYIVMAIAAGAIPELISAGPYAFDIMVAALAPITALQIILTSARGLSMLSKRISPTWAHNASTAV